MKKMEKKVLKRSLTVVGDIFSSLTNEALKKDRDFKLALYNSLAILFVLLLLVCFSGVYFILQPFLKPLLWALLCGSALHPFKTKLASKFRSRIALLQSSERPLSLNILFFPFYFVSKLADKLGNSVLKHFKLFASVLSVVFGVVLIYLYTPQNILSFSFSLYKLSLSTLNAILDTSNNTIITFSIFAGFLCALFFAWKPENEGILRLVSILAWVAGTGWLSNFLPYFRLVIFLVTNLSFAASFLFTLYYKTKTEDDSHITEEENTKENGSESSYDPTDLNDGLTSVFYIKHLTYACVFVVALSIPSIFYFGIGLFIIYTFKHLWIRFSTLYEINAMVTSIKTKLKLMCKERENVLFPPTLTLFLNGWRRFKIKFLNCVKEYCDSAATIVVILILLAGGVFFSIFMAYQAYREGIFLVQASGNIINSTIVHNPKLNEMIPDDWRSKIDEALNDAYIYIREGIANMIQSFLKRKGIDPNKSVELEREALQLWDRAYQAWVQPFQPTTGATTVIVSQDAVGIAYENFFEQLRKTPEVFNWDSGKSLIEDNMSMLKAGLDSVLTIIWGNMSLLSNIALTLFYLIFGGGISIINFVFNWVVFLTALFYLLNSSQETYIPAEMITQMCPQYGKRLAMAVELSCREVLAASLKLSVFYGLWTWLIHTVFMSNLAYMPAAFAAILGVVPVLGTYWACLPAVFDIWLLQGSKLRALCLFVAQIIPTMVVETTIYNEIQGSGHPYLTGLSVAGGIFWLGIEGAIAGPVILCIVFTLINMLSNDMPDS